MVTAVSQLCGQFAFKHGEELVRLADAGPLRGQSQGQESYCGISTCERSWTGKMSLNSRDWGLSAVIARW